MPTADADCDHDRCIDVIVPVYRDYHATKRCLASLCDAPVTSPCCLIVIDDASDDVQIQALLQHYAQAQRIQLIRHPDNRGFIAAVNTGLAVHPQRDVVLLNSDTEVANDWLDRLIACAATQTCIGTVTPFSNDATICSYPRLGVANPRPQAPVTLAQLDALAAKVNHGCVVDLPTAVGFCMLIRRCCLEQVGGFDQARFGRGYGEEVDFCQRATALGYRHVLAANIVVYHQGGASFGAEASDRKQAAQAIIDALYPDYQARIAQFFADDPPRYARRRLDIARFAQAPYSVLLITHARGGGVERHIQELVHSVSNHLAIMILTPYGENTQRLYWHDEAQQEEFELVINLAQDFAQVIDVLQQLRLNRLHYHQVAGLPKQVLQLPGALQCPYDVTLHDYTVICPRFHLTLTNGLYCGEPDSDHCNRCLQPQQSITWPGWPDDIVSWRQQWHDWLSGAARLISPSRDVQRRLQRYWPALPMVLWPHPWPHEYEQATGALQLGRVIKVLILGGLSLAKGLNLVKACARDAQQRQLPLFFRVIGPSVPIAEVWPQMPLSISGSYEDRELPALIAVEKPDVFLFPAQIPETFSYTLCAAMRTGYPIVASDLGAFQERLAEYDQAYLLMPTAAPALWNDQLLGCASVVPAAPSVVRSAWSTHEIASYCQRYMAAFSPMVATDITQDYSLPLAWLYPIADQVPAPMGLSALYSAVVDYGHHQWRAQFAQIVPTTELELADAQWERKALRQQVRELEAYYSQQLHNERWAAQTYLQIERQACHDYIAQLTQEYHALQAQLQLFDAAIWRRFGAQLRHQVGHKVKRAWQLLQGVQRRQAWSLRWLWQARAMMRQASAQDELSGLPPSAPITQYTNLKTESSLAQPIVSIIIPLTGTMTTNGHWFDPVSEQVGMRYCSQIEVIVCGTDMQLAALPGHALRARREHWSFCAVAADAQPQQIAQQALQQAQGRYLLWLAADMTLAPETISLLLDQIQQTDVGLVTAKLLFGSRWLLAAGAILWADGSVWYDGYGDNPEKPFYMVARRLLVSPWGCCCLARERLMAVLDRAPLATTWLEWLVQITLALVAQGYSVLYQPGAIARTAEHLGPQADAGRALLDAQQCQRLQLQWSAQIAQCFPVGERLEAARIPFIQKRVLLIAVGDDQLTTPASQDVRELLTLLTHHTIEITLVIAQGALWSSTERYQWQQRGVICFAETGSTAVQQVLLQIGPWLDHVMLYGAAALAHDVDVFRNRALKAQLSYVVDESQLTPGADLSFDACRAWWSAHEQHCTLMRRYDETYFRSERLRDYFQSAVPRVPLVTWMQLHSVVSA
jgi:GT2 family glycosyltransferase/glycosyltransferase involved in cell wall biosynthesis/predicted DNA-binding protein YlxM (UPF0122 family)